MTQHFGFNVATDAIMAKSYIDLYFNEFAANFLRGKGPFTNYFALSVGRWSEKRVVYYIKSANKGRTWLKKSKK